MIYLLEVKFFIMDGQFVRRTQITQDIANFRQKENCHSPYINAILFTCLKLYLQYIQQQCFIYLKFNFFIMDLQFVRRTHEPRDWANFWQRWNFHSECVNAVLFTCLKIYVYNRISNNILFTWSKFLDGQVFRRTHVSRVWANFRQKENIQSLYANAVLITSLKLYL